MDKNCKCDQNLKTDSYSVVTFVIILFTFIISSTKLSHLKLIQQLKTRTEICMH